MVQIRMLTAGQRCYNQKESGPARRHEQPLVMVACASSAGVPPKH